MEQVIFYLQRIVRSFNLFSILTLWLDVHVANYSFSYKEIA